MKTIKIFFLKRRFKNLWLKAKYGFDQYSCGHKLKLHMSNDYYATCKKFNEVADQLDKLVEDVPKYRFELS